MYCENCGARIDDDSRFCENCGVLVKPDGEPDLEGEALQTDQSPAEREEKAITDLDDLMELDMGSPLKKETETTQIFTKEAFFKETGHADWEPEILDKNGEEAREPEEPEPQAVRLDSTEEQEGGPEQEAAVMASAEPEDEDSQETELFAAEPQVSEQEEPEPSERSEEQEKREELFIWKRTDDPADADPAEAWEPEAIPEQRMDTSIQEEPLQENLEAEEADKPLFCMACGKRLPQGAAFCDACGTPTGEVAPVEIHRKRPGQGMFLELAKEFFVRPAAALEKAASEDAFLPGIVFLLVKDVILAVLAAVFMGKLSAVLGIFGAWLIQGDPFGFGAKAFLVSVVLDGLWIGLLYGAGRLFKGKGSIRELTGACGTASLLAAVLLIVTTVLTAFVPVSALCAGLITLAATIAVMTKAAAQAMQMDENLGLYAVPAAFACFSVIVFVVLRLLA